MIFGLTTMNVITINIIIDNIFLNSPSPMSTAILAPIIDPIRADMPRYKLKGKFLIPLLLKPSEAKTAVVIIANLLVPLATLAGSPRKIKIGRVKIEAPPARVLIIDMKKPTKISNTYIQKS